MDDNDESDWRVEPSDDEIEWRDGEIERLTQENKRLYVAVTLLVAMSSVLLTAYFIS